MALQNDIENVRMALAEKKLEIDSVFEEYVLENFMLSSRKHEFALARFNGREVSTDEVYISVYEFDAEANYYVIEFRLSSEPKNIFVELEDTSEFKETLLEIGDICIS